jgi:uncharacterized membrane protein
MTVMADTERQNSAGRKLLWIILALSLTLNICFVGGLVWTRMHHPPGPMERLERLGKALDLSDDQTLAYEQFVRVIRQRGRFVRETNQPLLAKIWNELAKPGVEDAAVTEIGDQIRDNRAAFQKEASAALLAFNKTLTPEQRRRLADIAQAPKDEAARRFFSVVVP